MSRVATNQIEVRDQTGQAHDITPLVRKFVWRESLLDGGFSWELRLHMQGRFEWSRFIVGLENPEFRVSSIITSPFSTQTVSTEWMRAIVDRSSIAYQSVGAALKIIGADRRLSLQQHHRTRAWPSRPTSAIVQEIAAEHGLTPMVVATEDVRDRWQVRMTDWDFLCKTARRAATLDGRGDLFLFMDGNTLHYQPVASYRPPTRVFSVAEDDGRPRRVVVGFNGRPIDRAGGGFMRSVGFDFQLKQGIVHTVRGADVSVYPALSASVPRAMDASLSVFPTSEFTFGLTRHHAQSRWGRAAPRYFSIRLDVLGDLRLRPVGTFDVISGTGPQTQSPLLGRYAMYEVQHVLSGGRAGDAGLVTTIVGYRREAGIGAEPSTGSAVGAVTHVVDTRIADRVRVVASSIPGAT